MRIHLYGDSNTVGLYQALTGTLSSGEPRMAPEDWVIVNYALGGSGTVEGFTIINNQVTGGDPDYIVPDVAIIGYNGGVEGLESCDEADDTPLQITTQEEGQVSCRILLMRDKLLQNGVSHVITTKGLGFNSDWPINPVFYPLLTCADNMYELVWNSTQNLTPNFHYSLAKPNFYLWTGAIHASNDGYKIIAQRAIDTIESLLPPLGPIL